MIKYLKESAGLILAYSSEGGTEWIQTEFNFGDSVTLRNTFTFQRDDLLIGDDEDIDFDETLRFKLGDLVDDYYKIPGRIFQISNDVYLDRRMKLGNKIFTSERIVSIFPKIHSLVKRDIYIGGIAANSIPLESYHRVTEMFPNSYEIQLYMTARIAAILKNYFDDVPDVQPKYDKYLNKKTSLKGGNVLKQVSEYEVVKYQLLLSKLEAMLVNENGYNERQWQNEILQIILLLYPKYIRVFKESPVLDASNKKRKIDFLLVDSSGHIDIIEIKRPLDNKIVSNNQYRDNYIPLKELSGTIMQIEKYIFSLNRWGKRGEETLTRKYKLQLPKDFEIKIVNPNGLIIMGRETGLTLDQKGDLEVIKRKYKNLIDIITYDELIGRLRFTIEQFRKSDNLD